jgi:hypothetical protein
MALQARSRPSQRCLPSRNGVSTALDAVLWEVKMITLERRAVLGFCACLVAPIALLAVATRLPDDDDVIIVRGWILKRSDLRKLGW